LPENLLNYPHNPELHCIFNSNFREEGRHIVRNVLFTALILIVLAIMTPSLASGQSSQNGDNLKTSSSRNADEHSQDDVYYGQIESSVNDWISYGGSDGSELIDSGVITIEEDNYTISLDLEPGFYNLNGMADERCTNIVMDMVTETGSLPQDYTDYGAYPYNNFVILEPTTLDIELQFEFDSSIRNPKTCFGYLIVRTAGTDNESRRNYMETTLGWYNDPAMTDTTILLDDHIGHLTRANDSETFEYDLEPGYYYVSGEGGLDIKSLTVYITDEDGNSLYEYAYGDKYPWADFTLDEPHTVTVEFNITNFVDGFDDGYYCFVLANPPEEPDYYGDEYDSYNGWSGDELELSDAAQWASDAIIDSAEKHGEEVVEVYQETATLESEENGIYIDLDLDPGTYYVYVQGDGICLYGLSVIIYGEDASILDESSSGASAAVCRFDVVRGDGPYKVWVGDYFLDCYIGYFNVVLTQE
jgi:hypothetical protein